MVTRVASLPSRLLKGESGEQGEAGKQGLQGIQGSVGKQGTKGTDGTAGRSPEHEIKNGEIRFKQPDGQFGEFLSISSLSGGGKISENTYTSISTATFKIPRASLDLGLNVFGVRVTPVTITLPKKVDKRSIIVIKDEVGDAGTDNITIKVESI